MSLNDAAQSLSIADGYTCPFRGDKRRTLLLNPMIITSIDFETANHSRASICAAGMAVFVNGTLTETPYWLVRPPQGHGWFREDFIECHGLTHLDVRDAPQFPDIAPTFLKWLTCSDIVIAHNAPFDIAHLRVTLEHFCLPCPGFDYLCTCNLARRVWPELPNHKLHTLAEHVGHAFNHHHAGDDAEAAGRVLLAMMKEVKATTLTELLQQTGVVLDHFEKIDTHQQEGIGAAL